MSERKFSIFLGRITHAVMLTVLCPSILIARSLETFSASDVLSAYHSYPYMFEHILCGVAVYLAFSVIVTKIHRSSLHENGGGRQN